MNNPIGVMQGRLIPSWSGKMQAFPESRWEEEFSVAAKVGFRAIEWLLDEGSGLENPVWSGEKRLRIKHVMEKHGLIVPSICADYVQGSPLSVLDKNERFQRASTLRAVIEMAQDIGAQCVLVPCCENDLEPDSQGEKALIESLKVVLKSAFQHGVKVALEMDWPVTDQCRLMEKIGHAALGIYYDLGNATSHGYNLSTDIRKIGQFLVGVHIKDRKVGGGSVLLGEGDTDFIGGFQALRGIRYEGPFILETPRGIDPVDTARKHLDFVKHTMAQVAAEKGRK